jgi:hypothetical protein
MAILAVRLMPMAGFHGKKPIWRMPCAAPCNPTPHKIIKGIS